MVLTCIIFEDYNFFFAKFTKYEVVPGVKFHQVEEIFDSYMLHVYDIGG